MLTEGLSPCESVAGVCGESVEYNYFHHPYSFGAKIQKVESRTKQTCLFFMPRRKYLRDLSRKDTKSREQNILSPLVRDGYKAGILPRRKYCRDRKWW